MCSVHDERYPEGRLVAVAQHLDGDKELRELKAKLDPHNRPKPTRRGAHEKVAVDAYVPI